MGTSTLSVADVFIASRRSPSLQILFDDWNAAYWDGALGAPIFSLTSGRQTGVVPYEVRLCSAAVLDGWLDGWLGGSRKLRRGERLCGYTGLGAFIILRDRQRLRRMRAALLHEMVHAAIGEGHGRPFLAELVRLFRRHHPDALAAIQASGFSVAEFDSVWQESAS